MRIWTLDHAGCHPTDSRNWEQLIADKTHVIWVDLDANDPETIEVLRDKFQFHPLAIEDTGNERQRPKVEEYEDHLFTILNPIKLVDHELELEFRELDVFLGENYLVTVHTEHEPMIDEVVQRVSKRAGAKLPVSSGYLLYALVDTMVDSYFPLVDTVGDKIEEISEQILHRPRQTQLAKLFHLKRELGEMGRVVGSQRDMFAIITHEEAPYINHDILNYYLRDVYDHLLRVNDVVNTFRDNLSNVIDLYLSAVSNRLNLVVQRLTVITIGSGIMAVITGFYGMNFLQTFPPWSADWGVPFVLLLMILAAAIIAFALWWLD
jgi:magnesium transporter